VLLASRQKTKNGKLSIITGDTRAIKGSLLEIKGNTYGPKQWVQRIVSCFSVSAVCLRKETMQL